MPKGLPAEWQAGGHTWHMRPSMAVLEAGVSVHGDVSQHVAKAHLHGSAGGES